MQVDLALLHIYLQFSVCIVAKMLSCFSTFDGHT